MKPMLVQVLSHYMNRYDLKVRTLRIQKKTFCDKDRELTKEEYAKLLNVAKQAQNDRLYYLMQTIGSTGIRISVLKYITCDAVKTGQATINCKGKIRQVLLPNQLCIMLKTYIKKKHINRGPVFVTKNGHPIDRSVVWKMLKNLCRSAGVAREKVFPHNFRYLFARTFYSVRKDIVRLADLLGHSNINTTRIYTMESGEAHRQYIQRLGLLLC